jgi:hypothetical protein
LLSTFTVTVPLVLPKKKWGQVIEAIKCYSSEPVYSPNALWILTTSFGFLLFKKITISMLVTLASKISKQTVDFF